MGGKLSRHPRRPQLATVKVQHCYCIRMTCDMMLFFHNVRAVTTSLERPQNIDNVVNQKIILRANQNTAYLNKEKYFECGGFLGRGSFGTVELVCSRSEGKFYALKSMVIPYKRPISKVISDAFVERDAWLTLGGKHVVKLKAAWIECNQPDRADTFCMLCELMPRGSMRDLIDQLHPMTTAGLDFRWSHGCCNAIKDATFSPLVWSSHGQRVNMMTAEPILIKEHDEILSRFKNIFLMYIDSLIRAVTYLHEHDIVHRDLKPDNILVTADLRLKLSDLGIATPFKKEQMMWMYSWTEYDTTVQRTMDYTTRWETEHYPNMEDTFTTFRQERLGGLKAPGTRIYQPPEYHDLYFEMPGREHERFQYHRHFPGDWYAVGLIIYKLVTGINCLQYVQIFKEFSGIPDRDMLFYAKYMPRAYNRFIYGVEEYGRLLRRFVIDERFLGIIRLFLEPEHSQRATGNSVLAKPFVEEFFNSCRRVEETPGWQWNEFRHNPAFSSGMQLMRAYGRGERHPFKLSQRAGSQQIPDLPLFPIMTESPNIVPSP